MKARFSFLLIVLSTVYSQAGSGNTPISLLDFEPAKINAAVSKDYYATSKNSKASECRLFKKHEYALELMKSMSKWILLHPNDGVAASLLYEFKKPISYFSFIPHNAHPNGVVTFFVYADDKLIKKVTKKSKDPSKQITLKLKNCSRLKLEVRDGGKHVGSMAVWKNPTVKH